jgi:putative ABC transport system permease protein
MIRSLRLAIRSLLNSPGFAVLSIAILALGIGATTAMFSVARTVLLKPLAFKNPEQLCVLSLRVPAYAEKYPELPVSAVHQRVWTTQSRTIQDVAFMQQRGATLSGHGEAEHVNGVRTTANIFRLFGAAPALGPGFAGDEEKTGHDDVVVVSDRLWRRKLSTDPNIIGQKLLLDGRPYQVVGVMPADLPFPKLSQIMSVANEAVEADFWRPLVFKKEDLAQPLGDMNNQVIGRMAAGATVPQVVSELNGLEQQFKKDFPPGVTLEVRAAPLQERLAGEVKRPLLILMTAVGMVLLVVCLNLMNLTLVRALSRRRQWAIRLAMGASQGALVRETFLESLVLSLTGGALGCLLAAWLLALVRANAPAALPRVNELTLDWPAMAIAVVASVGSALLFGVWPAWRASHIDPQEALRASSRSMTEGRGGHRLGQMLVAGEVALSVVLLLGAGLLMRSFMNTMNVNPGVAVERTVTATIKLPPDHYHGDAEVASFYTRLLGELRQSAGVEEAGLTSTLPMTGEDNVSILRPCDGPERPISEWPATNLRQVSPRYFSASGTPIKSGRDFTTADADAKVIVLSENLSERLWPGQSPMGRAVCGLGDTDGKVPYQVIGVVGDVRAASLRDKPVPMAYVAEWGKFGHDMALTVRTKGDARPVINNIRRTVAQLDAGVPVTQIRTMEEVVSESMSGDRFQLLLLGGFAAAAVLLACLGIYGVLAFTVGRRTPEIGIRMALGAWPGQVRWAMLKHGMVPVIVGLAVGLAASFALGRVMESMLFGLHALDPLTYMATALASLGAATLACLMPADRAARLNPVEALRME